MATSSMQVYARLKKEGGSKERNFYVDRSSTNPNHKNIVFLKASCAASSSIRKFRFYEVFEEESDQKQVFERVAKPVVERVLQGFNGTIFAYGQTGSGKTYSMTGSFGSKYGERGIIPRCLECIFSELEKMEEKPTIYISYKEIYNEVCYDLLSPRSHKVARRLEELPRVVVLEDKKGEPHLRNLTVMPVDTEEEAMRLLFLGDTNRTIAETPLNEYSSRSHSIFTIYLRSRPHIIDQHIIHSKLNLVDLAGSERVYKSKISGSILEEAKQINLSLHFLQQVILALSQPKKAHIPYRNSLMTFILKDSLGGNCLTVMLATLSTSKKNVLETISTCKFAQRVSLIKLDPVINEVTDPYQEILILRREVEELRVKLLSSQKGNFPAPPADLPKETLKEKLELYLKGSDESLCSTSLTQNSFQCCLEMMKAKILALETKLDGLNSSSAVTYRHQDGSENNKSQANVRSEIESYHELISEAYERAKVLAFSIEEYQANINHLRDKLDIAGKYGDLQKKILLSEELEKHQQVYKENLAELKSLRNETLHLEAGLAKAKAKMPFPNENTDMPVHLVNCRVSKEKFSDFPPCNGLLCCNNFKDCCSEGFLPPIQQPFSSGFSGLAALQEDIKVNHHRNYDKANEPSHESNNDTTLCELRCNSLYEEPYSDVRCSLCTYDSTMRYQKPEFLQETPESLLVEHPDVQLVPDKLVASPLLRKECTNFPSPCCSETCSVKPSSNKNCEIIEDYGTQERKLEEFFLEGDTEEFREFMKTVDLTGDAEIDAEIFSFYRTKFRH